MLLSSRRLATKARESLHSKVRRLAKLTTLPPSRDAVSICGQSQGQVSEDSGALLSTLCHPTGAASALVPRIREASEKVGPLKDVGLASAQPDQPLILHLSIAVGPSTTCQTKYHQRYLFRWLKSTDVTFPGTPFENHYLV